MRPTKPLLCSLLTSLFALSGNSLLALDSPALSLARQLNEAFIEVADKVSPAVVVIEITEKPAEEEGSWWNLLPPEERRRHRRRHQQPVQAEGSGVIVSEDGYILTNNHVVENADKILVRFKDGRSFDAEVRGRDPESDIAVIKIKAKSLTPAKLGDSDSTRVGEFVVAIGAPFALSYSVTYGHVSAKGRSFEGETRGYADQDFIQTDASINPGNSGGPLVNLYGEVIAINTMIEGMNTGIGFAVPINLAKRVKDHLIAEGKFTRSWIGVGIDELNDYREFRDLGKQLAPDTDSGVVVTAMMANSPAAKSELRTGDVIISVDGKTVKTARELKESISLQPPGKTLAFSVVRGTQHLSFKVKTEALPSNSDIADDQSRPENQAVSETFGLTVQPATKELAQEYEVKAGSGLIITAVEPDSAADQKGLEPGDVIMQINRQHIHTTQEFRQALKTADSRKGLMLEVLRDGSKNMVILKETDR